MKLQETVVDTQSAGMRLDLFVTRCLPGPMKAETLSRSGAQKLIAEGQITLNGKRTKAGTRLKFNDLVTVTGLTSRPTDLIAEPIALDVIYEDEDCIVINKAPGMMVHPAAGRRLGTLVNAVLYRCPELQGIGGESRPGIVHRLDKDTSGVMVVAKSSLAFQQLARQFKDRRVKKEYLALVWGKLKGDHGTVDRPIGRHRSDRKRMSSLHALPKRREAVTDWSLEKCYRNKNGEIGPGWVSLLRLMPRTGRTHQIRVHLADLGHPLIGDRVYGRKRPNKAARSGNACSLDSFSRQALHAERLGILHPRSGRPAEFYAPLADDMTLLLETLKGDDLA